MALLAAPADASAQRDEFVDALIAFRLSLAGSFGDEGRQITTNLDRLSSSLEGWDRTLAETEGALRLQLTAATLDQTLQIRATLASLFIQRGRLADALAEIDAALVVDPERPAFHLLRGLVHRAAGDPEAAGVDFEQAWTLDRDDPIKAYLLLDRRTRSDAPADLPAPLVDVLLTAASSALGPRPVSFIELALIEDRAADWPVFAPAAYAPGLTAVVEQQYADAIARFRAAAAEDPLLVDPALGHARMARGIDDLRNARFAGAIEHFQAVATEVPASSEARRLLAAALAADGRHADAMAHLEAAVRLSPRDERVRLALARVLMTLERWDDVEAALRDTIDVLPASADARWLLADVYEQHSRGTEALRELEAAAEQPMLAGRSQLAWRVAELAHRHQDFEGVTRALAVRARLNPNEPIAHKDLGLAQMRRGAREDALVELLMTLLLGHEDAETLATIGQIHVAAGRHAQAEPVLRQALALDPGFAQARFALGTALVRLGRREEGREQLAEFQRLRAAQLEAQRRTFAVGNLFQEAERHTGEGRPDLAAGVWEQIVELEPDDPAHRLELASALARAGDAEAAVRHLEAAAAMSAPPPEVHRELALLYAQLGRAEDSAHAQATYDRLLREASAPATAR